ncbi:hypothetical protein MKEN_00914600 [Mycena kentingensis (nom. inval.)]|nr:hypothetical protein MKEN_00914600 [Mycena kentingensis (nom. inval.)]
MSSTHPDPDDDRSPTPTPTSSQRITPEVMTDHLLIRRMRLELQFNQDLSSCVQDLLTLQSRRSAAKRSVTPTPGSARRQPKQSVDLKELDLLQQQINTLLDLITQNLNAISRTAESSAKPMTNLETVNRLEGLFSQQFAVHRRLLEVFQRATLSGRHA